MAKYVGKQDSPGGLVKSITIIRERFDAARHASFAGPARAFLALGAKYEKAAKAVDAPAAAEEAAVVAVSDADAQRDLAVRELDTALIAAGAPKKNSFKRYGVPAPGEVCSAGINDETKYVVKLLKALSNHDDARVKTAVRALKQANDAVMAERTNETSARAAAAKARLARDTQEYPLRKALSILKLSVKLAEETDRPGVYAELFAIDATPRKRRVAKAPAA